MHLSKALVRFAPIAQLRLESLREQGNTRRFTLSLKATPTMKLRNRTRKLIREKTKSEHFIDPEHGLNDSGGCIIVSLLSRIVLRQHFIEVGERFIKVSYRFIEVGKRFIDISTTCIGIVILCTIMAASCATAPSNTQGSSAL